MWGRRIGQHVTRVTEKYFAAPHGRNCAEVHHLLGNTPREGVTHMSASTDAKANTRMIFASFAAGVGAMMFLGLVAPTIIKGGLSLTSANASTIEAQAPEIAPLDVAAIRAQLAEAEQDMASVRATTDDDVARLARLSH